jgi:hypothetical protein
MSPPSANRTRLQVEESNVEYLRKLLDKLNVSTVRCDECCRVRERLDDGDFECNDCSGDFCSVECAKYHTHE